MDEELDKEEMNLAEIMKTKYCDKTGKESEPKKAAEIIYKIGKIYRKRSPNKISLIKSVGLLNAAIVRNPSNLSDIKKCLFETCKHILIIASAINQNVDLMKKADEVKQSFNELRNEVDQLLDKLANQTTTRILLIQQLNQTIALKYRRIMAGLGQFCEDVMGKPPCEYAIAGMGSLARMEITPYSDFEHIILLNEDKNYKSYLEYFRWYSTIFHTIILNVQETIIPSLYIKTLNDKYCKLGNWYFDAYTPRGISFDGLMPHASKFPLGRIQHTKDKPFETELIKPVNEMLNYLSSEENLKNGYHLADILTKTCFVFGNKDVFKQFETSVKNYLKITPKPKRLEEVKQQVKDDLDNYSTRFRLANLKSQNTLNIKQLIYRSTTIFIAALARIHNISANSSFEIINEMQKLGEATIITRDKLHYAIAIACEIRLKVYSKSKSQNDSPIRLTKNNESLIELLEIAGAANTIKYFQVAYCLQCEVAKQLNFTKLHFYSDPQILNFKLGIIFDINGLKIGFLRNKLKFVWKRKEFVFDQSIAELEIPSSNDYFSNTSKPSNDIELMDTLADHLHLTRIYDEALEFYQATFQMKQNISVDQQKDGSIATTLNNIGECLREMQKYNDALNHLKKSLEIKRNISLEEQKDGNIATTLNNIGECLREMQQYDDALNNLKQSLKIKQNTSLDEWKDSNIARTLNNIGLCLLQMHQYDNALIHLKQSLDIDQNMSLDEQRDSNIARTLNNIGECLREMQQYNNALIHLKQSLEIDQNISLNEQKDGNIAKKLNNIGECLREMQQYDNALIHFKQSLEIDRNISLDERKDDKIATTLNNIGLCLMEMQHYSDSLIHLKQSLEIKRNILFDEPKDGNIATTLNNIGVCLMHMRQYDSALIDLKQSLEIERKLSLDGQQNGKIARVLNNIGFCLMQMQQYDNALNHLKQSLVIYQNISVDERKDGKIATTLNNIGLCLMEMQKYNHALIDLKQSLEIKRTISLNEQNDVKIATTLNNIGLCLMEMQQYDNALIYLEQSLEIKRNISRGVREDGKIATTLNNIGECLREMQQFDNALFHFKKSLEIKRNISLDERKDGKIATILNKIGLCLIEAKQYDNALIHLEESLEIKRKISLDEREDRSIDATLNNIGLCLKEMQKYNDAFIQLKQ